MTAEERGVGHASEVRFARARSLLGRAAPVVATLIGLVLALRSLFLGVTLSSPVPTFDSWAFVDDLGAWRAGRYGLADLFSQHNEHRIVTARLNFFLDAWLFHLGNLSVVVADYLLFGILAAVLAAVATCGRPVRVRLAALTLALAALWSAAGWINLVWSFQIQWAYVHLMPVLAVLAFVWADARPGARRWMLFAAACLCDALAVFSMSSGLMTIVPVLAVAIWRRASPRLIAIFVAVHAGLIALFLWEYEAPTQTLVVSPVAVVRYLAPYLGTAFPGSKASSIDLGAVGLIVSLAALMWATSTALVQRRRVDASSAVLLGAVTFVLAEGLATAFGRAGLPNPTQLAMRYATPSELLWTALGLCAWRWLDATGQRWAARGLAAMAVGAVLASNLAGGTAAAWQAWSAQADNEGFNLINGIKTDERGQGLDPLPDENRVQIDLLRNLQLGPFAEGASRFRSPLNSLAGVMPAALPACAGEIDQFTVRDGTVYHLQGWAATPGVPVSAVWALAVAPDGHVLGTARTWQLRRDPRRLSGRTDVLGYDFWLRRPIGQAGQRIDIVAVFPGGTVPPCRLTMPDHATPQG